MTGAQFFKFIFHRDTIALVASLVFLWFTLSLFSDSNYDINELRMHKGQLISIDSVIIKKVDKLLFKETTKALHLTISGERKYFSTITKKDFGYVVSQITLMDTITIYTKPRFLGVFGIKSPRDICQLTIDDKIVIDFEKYKESISLANILTLIATFGFFFYYFIRARKRYHLLTYRK